MQFKESASTDLTDDGTSQFKKQNLIGKIYFPLFPFYCRSKWEDELKSSTSKVAELQIGEQISKYHTEQYKYFNTANTCWSVISTKHRDVISDHVPVLSEGEQLNSVED